MSHTGERNQGQQEGHKKQTVLNLVIPKTLIGVSKELKQDWKMVCLGMSRTDEG